YTPFGGAMVPRGGVAGYRVYRTTQGGAQELIATVAPGVGEITDPAVTDAGSYTYTVRPFDQDNETDLAFTPGSAADLARIVVIGGTPPTGLQVRRYTATLVFDAVLDLQDPVAVEAFKSDLASLLAAQLGISQSRVHVLSVRAGSVIAEVRIVDDLSGSGEPTAADAFANLMALIVDTTVDEFASLAPLQSFSDASYTESVVLQTPTDPQGAPVVGWFTRRGTQVGFDDFFLFADNFGRREGDAGFDAAFDIVQNGAVDFDDFFRFADDFGKTVANAAAIQQQLGF
ncbi:MAG: hypothetical protein ABIL09_03920, partial [Gemmatimonadota bacterium]